MRASGQKRVIVALVSASKGKLVGKLRLYKAFYRAHLEYFSATGLDLTGYPMVHMQDGAPGIDNAQELIDELREDGHLVEKVGTPRRPNERVYHFVRTGSCRGRRTSRQSHQNRYRLGQILWMRISLKSNLRIQKLRELRWVRHKISSWISFRKTRLMLSERT